MGTDDPEIQNQSTFCTVHLLTKFYHHKSLRSFFIHKETHMLHITLVENNILSKSVLYQFP